MPTALIITAAGINCDLELTRAFELAGCEATSLHLNELLADPSLTDTFDLIGIPGGFSYGDAIAAGRVMAQLMRQHLYGPLVRAIERGTPIVAPCNGFQILSQMGLLPGPPPGEPWPEQPPTPTIALAQNQGGRFVDRWTRVEFPGESRCIWTRDITGDHDTLRLPNAHGEGRFVVDDPAIIDRLAAHGQIAVQFHADDNFNGSMAGIAGLCDATGLVLGLMPHPERSTRWTQHPFWTRLDDAAMNAEPPGLQIFRNAVAHVMRAQDQEDEMDTRRTALQSTQK